MNPPVRPFPVLPIALLAAISLFACNKERTPAASGQGGTGGNEVVATYGGKTITMQELDQKIGDQLFELRRQALEQIIIEDLVKTEAQKRGMTEEEYLKTEIEAKAPSPSEEEMQRYFQQIKPQLPPDMTFDQVRDRIRMQMSRPQQQERARELFAELKKNANVDIKLQQPLPPKKEVEAKGPAKGPENAPVTIVEFSDFQCPFCARAADTVDQVMETYPGKVRLVFRHFPLEIHAEAPEAAEAAMCASDQNKFWEYHDVLFEKQGQLGTEDLKQHAQALGLDMAKFEQCLTSDKYADTVKQDLAAGQKLGVTGTPAFFINGRMLSGAQPIEEFKRVIDAELASAK